MGRQIQKRRLILLLLAALAAFTPSFAQDAPGQTDSLVRLMQAETLQLIEKDGAVFRKTVSPTFLHNGTYLICDTALWNVDAKLINCIGHVQLIQDETLLTSDKLDYLIDEDLAQFRGGLVELRNKQDNILRTRNLDYNTKDSLATFRSGASMRSAEGQVIESDEGTYSNPKSLFTFRNNVNMYTDSVFVKTEELRYDSKAETAEFPVYVDFWNEENMLSADNGWYRRKPDIFFFRGRVHGQTDTREMWSDSLYFYKRNNNVLLLGNAQVQDSTRKSTAVADHIFYEDSLSLVTLKNNAAVALRTEQKEKVDTIYCGADTLVYQAVRKCDIPEAELSSSSARLGDMQSDAIAAYRKRVAEEAEAAALQALKDKEDNLGVEPGTLTSKFKGGAAKAPPAPDAKAPAPSAEMPSADVPPADTTALASDAAVVPADSLGVLADSLGVAADSLAAAVDSLALQQPKDTSKISFIKAIRNVRIFRNDIQARCDSLVYSDLDSVARFYREPMVWNEGNRQYSADSLFVLVRNGGVEKASLMSNPFVVTQEDSLLFDQIKGTEIVAYFDDDSNLRRFDALGGASALFFIKEDDVFATVNKVESKLFYATLKEGEVDRIHYFDSPVNNAYPVVQLPKEEQKMKGFNWNPTDRPRSRYDVTTLEVKPSERSAYSARPRAAFKYTDRYFPGHIDTIHKRIEDARLRREADRALRDSLPEADCLNVADSLSVLSADSLALGDTLRGTARLADSLALKDSLGVAADSIGTAAAPEEDYMSPAELRRALRIAKRDARWDALDARDAEKAAAKQARKDARRQKREDRRAAKLAEQEFKDRAKLDKYIERYQKQKERNEGKHQPEPAGERPSGAEAGRELQSSVKSE